MEAVAQRGETVLVADGERGWVANVRTGEVYPGPLPLQGILARGYWRPIANGSAAKAVALVEPLVAAGNVNFTDGCMVCLYPMPEQQQALAVEGGQDPATLHVTLAFFPDPPDREAVLEALLPVAARHAPLEGKVGGVGMFAPGEKGTPLIALPSVDGLNELRADVARALDRAGAVYSRDHGYVPHLTLAYIDGGDEPETDDPIGQPLSFDAVVLVMGSDEIRVPLTGAVTAAAFDPAKHPRHPAGSEHGGEWARKVAAEFDVEIKDAEDEAFWREWLDDRAPYMERGVTLYRGMKVKVPSQFDMIGEATPERIRWSIENNTELDWDLGHHWTTDRKVAEAFARPRDVHGLESYGTVFTAKVLPEDIIPQSEYATYKDVTVFGLREGGESELPVRPGARILLTGQTIYRLDGETIVNDDRVGGMMVKVGDTLVSSVYVEAQHPRHPAGSERGGEWRAKGPMVNEAHVASDIDRYVESVRPYFTDPESPIEAQEARDFLWGRYHEMYDEPLALLRDRLAGFTDVTIQPDISQPLEWIEGGLSDPRATDFTRMFNVALPKNTTGAKPDVMVWINDRDGLSLEDVLDPTDSDFFPDSGTSLRYGNMLDALRGIKRTGTTTLYRGMSAAERQAWDDGDEIPAGKFFTSRPTTAYSADVSGEFPELHQFDVAAEDVVETDPGIFQTVRPTKLRRDGVLRASADHATLVAMAGERKISYEQALALQKGQAAQRAARRRRAFDEAQVRRWPTGTKVEGAKGGGRFAPKDAAKSAAVEEGGTDSVYMDEKGRWHPERQKLHRGIMESFLSDGKPQAEPTALFLAGGSGTGKSSVLELEKLAPDSSVLVNPDEVKVLLPEYREKVAAGDAGAAGYVHEESSYVAKQIARNALAEKSNVVIDGTGDSGEKGAFMGKIEAAKAAGHSVEVVLVDTHVDEALARAQARAKRTGRAVREEALREIHRNVSKQFADWSTKVDDWRVYANDGDRGEHRLIAYRENGGEIVVLDQERLDEFKRKAKG